MPMQRFAIALAAAVQAGMAVVPEPAGAYAASDARIEAVCRPFFGRACSEAMGRWLPGVWGPPVSTRSAANLSTPDAFAYEPWRTLAKGFAGSTVPSDGTFFVFGMAGPPKGHAVYDRAHRIAFYEVGCCSWSDVVLVAGAPEPPKYLAPRDLGYITTSHGLRLGMSSSVVERLVGPASAFGMPGQPALRTLLYTAPLHLPGVRNGCHQTERLVFRRGRLIEIDLDDAC